MQESAIVLSEYEDINSLLYKPIITTQRIKYTCINVSTNHIVLGSTSGSLYLFTREPCTFQQVIPLSLFEFSTNKGNRSKIALSRLISEIFQEDWSRNEEGPVTHVLISPDEKTIALSTKRGSVCVISLKPSVKLLSISNEHLNETVTCLCWNAKSSEIYAGDCNGKISTIVLSIFTVNGMFQAPSCALMHLDSSIVQIDYSIHYLLVSTLTRCYICDTAQEQFKQIGNKARDGDFGACFFNKSQCEFDRNASVSPEDERTSNRSSTVGLNSIIGLNEESADDENLLIYSARPGFRLWEVNIKGIVVKTHQFKDALTVPPSDIYKTTAIKSIHVNEDNEEIIGSQILNFSRLFVISKKYLLSYTNKCLYIIDPVNAAVILWTDKLNNITSAQIIDDKIYLMNSNGTFNSLMLSSIDYLILKLFEIKLYNDCLNACMTFRSDLMKLIESNRIIDSHSNEIIDDFNDCSNDLILLLEPIIMIIQSNFNTQPKRLNSGIVVVNSGNSLIFKNGKYDESSSDSEIVCNIAVRSKKNRVKNCNETNGVDEIGDKIMAIELNDDNLDKKINGDDKDVNQRKKLIESATMNIQMDFQPVYILIGTLKTSMNSEEMEDTIFKIVNSIKEINFKYEDIVELKIFLYEIVRSIERMYFHALLENINVELLRNTDNIYVIDELMRAFVDLNGSNYCECICGFPKFIEHLTEPKFIEIGKILMEKFSMESSVDNCIKLCKNVPFIWRNYLRIYINDNRPLDDILRLCLQTRDNTVLSIILPLLDSKQWDTVVEIVEMMEMGKCISCGRIIESTINKNELIDWSGVAQEIMKKEGMDSAMTFLGLAEKHLPEIKLNKSIFQSIIFTKLLRRYGYDKVIELDRNRDGNKEHSSICSTEIRGELVEALEKDLERPVNDNVFGSGAHHWGIRFKTKPSICPCCTLSLQTPVLLGNNGISIFPCGHAYHVNCLIQKKLTKCYLHSLN